jgi:hypothetical protein
MTSKLHRDDREFLQEMLASLAKRFGSDEVLLALSEIEEMPFDRLRRRRNAEQERATQRERGRNSERPSAVHIAERADAPPGKKSLLVNLALQFDHKAFLPTLPDIRHFLEMRGQDLGSVKQRSDAFRKIVSAVLGMSEEALERLIVNSRHSGPSQLGPLSDAIKAVGASTRSERNNSSLFAYESGERRQADEAPAPASDVNKSAQGDDATPKTAVRHKQTVEEGSVGDGKSSQPAASDPASDAASDINIAPQGDKGTVSTSTVNDQAVAAEFVEKSIPQPSSQDKRPHNRYDALRSQNRNPPKRNR